MTAAIQPNVIIRRPPCEYCGKPVSPGFGCLDGDVQAALERLRVYADYDHEHPPGEVVRLTDVPLVPLARWVWSHRTCGPDLGYPIDDDRIDDVFKAVDWWDHLSEKVWFQHTNWAETIRQLFGVSHGT